MRIPLSSRTGHILPSGLFSRPKRADWLLGSALVLTAVVGVTMVLLLRRRRQALESAPDIGAISDSESATTSPQALESPIPAASPGIVVPPLADSPIMDSGIGNDPGLAVTVATEILPLPEVIVDTPSFHPAKSDPLLSPATSPIAASPFAAIKQPPPWSAPARTAPRRTLHRVMVTAVLVVSSIALVYGALGAIKSHNNKRTPADLKTAGPIYPARPADTREETAMADAPAPEAPAVAEPAPPAENGEPQDSAPPAAPSATAAVPKSRAHSRKHKVRSVSRPRRSSTETGSMLPRIH